MKTTASSLIRWSGLSAIVAGVIFAGIQPIHPPDVLSSVNTSLWAIITTLKTSMSIFGLLAITGLYAAPRFVESTSGMSSGAGGPMNLGAFATAFQIVSYLYLVGLLLFGIAMFRARILPRLAAGLLALSGPLAIVMVMLLPHQFERLAAIPMGIALAWLGIALLSERREKVTEPILGSARLQPAQAEGT